MTLLLNSTSTALWHEIIQDAEQTCDIALKEDVESYLVFLLMRYTDKPEFMKKIIAVEFLRGMKLPSSQREVALQEVGDNCLLYAGLFPAIAEKRLVKLSYFVNLGQSAYIAISRKRSDLYSSLGRQFVPLMDVLQSVRQYSKSYPDLLPLQAYEQWNETGSQRAMMILKQYTTAIPVISEIKEPNLFNK